MKNSLKLVLAIFIIANVVTSCTTIDSASHGIKFHKWNVDDNKHGGVIGTVKGFVWYNPFTQRVFEYPGYEQRKDYGNIKVNAKDGGIFDISPNIAYRLDPNKIIDIFITYRRPLKDIENGFMYTCIYEAYRTVGNRFTSDSLMTNRGIFESEVRLRLEESLMEKGFLISEFTAQIDPPPSLRQAIDAKNTAIQEALKVANEVAKAKANAEIEITKSQGEAKALMIRGDGEAYYNRVVAASLNQLLVNQYAVEKWNGVLPTYNGGGVLPFIDIKK